MDANLDHRGRPTVVVTGMGVLTSLGQGQADNWRKLLDGVSGIHRISRFPIAHLRTTIAGTVDFVSVDEPSAPALTEAIGALVAQEALAESGIGTPGDFPGPLLLAMPPVEMEWPQRIAAAEVVGARQRARHLDEPGARRQRRPLRPLARALHVRLGRRTPGRALRHQGRRRSPPPPPARPARPRSSSASRRSAAARPRPLWWSAPTPR